MRTPVIIKEDLYQLLKEEADGENRTVTNLVDTLLRLHFSKTGVPQKTTPTITPKEYKPGDVYDPLHPPKKIAEAAPRVDDLFSPPELVPTIVGLDKGISPRSNGLEQPCCLNELQPCKHWVWDTQSGEGYKNVLSGRFMDVD